MFIALHRHQMLPRHSIVKSPNFITLSTSDEWVIPYDIHICNLLNRYWFNYYLTTNCSIRLDFKSLHIAIIHFNIEQ